MTVFVTGAEGFIGSHVVETLVRSGRKVKALYLYNSLDHRGWLEEVEPEILRDVEAVAGDIRDPELMMSAMAGVDEVINLAALISIPYSYEAPRSYLHTNVLGTLNVLEAARFRGVRSFVQISTSEVYGSALSTPMSETHRIRAQSPYSASKIAADQLALSYHDTHGLPVVVIRPFNTFGPRQSLRAFIPQVITQLLNDTGTISLGATNSIRDLTFVRDTAAGITKAISSPKAIGLQLNLGTGFGWSVEEIVQKIAKLMGMDPVVIKDEKRLRPEKSEVTCLISDPSLAADLLGWRPELVGDPGLEVGLERTIDWFRARNLEARYLI